MEYKLLQECIDYFQHKQGLQRALSEIKEKYRSLGKLSGRIVLKGLTLEEKDALSAFLNKNYYQEKASIAVANFQAALDKTKFAGIDFTEVLEGYFQEKLVSKKEVLNARVKTKGDFFAAVIDQMQGTPAGAWLNNVLAGKKNAYQMLSQKYESSPELLQREILAVCAAINNLPMWEEQKMRLALFASKISKNPHGFDENTDSGKLLLYAVAFTLGRRHPENAEEKLEMLFHAGIIKDEISNFTMCSGLLGYQVGKIHDGWQGFMQAGEPLQVSLLNLSTIDKIISPRGKIFVFENPTVFTEVFAQTSAIKPALMCTYGQIKVASYILLDMLAKKEGTIIYYSGDFDPEGLLIADRLKSRYGENLILWRYSSHDYLSAISHKKIEPMRLKKLEKLKTPELKEVAQLIKENGHAGYQELLTEKLADDVRIYSLSTSN